MTLWIDADAAPQPVKEICFRASDRLALQTVLVANQRLPIPPGYAHGFVTLSDDAEVYYMISAPHAPEQARGFRWNDPAFAIQWQLTPSVISPRDAAYPLLESTRR